MPGERPPTVHEAAGSIHGEGAVQATAEVVSLDAEADREGLSIADQVALRTQELREWMADRVVPAFLWANGMTLGAIAVMWLVDEINLARGIIAPSDRIIGSQVIMALLGATTVQVGTIAVIIARYLFPGHQP